MISKLENDQLVFVCPGCDEYVYIPVTGPRAWTFNGDVESPTLSPSILRQGVDWPTEDELTRIHAGEDVPARPVRCHCFISNGVIEFLSDCTHALAGQKVPMPTLD